MKLHSNKRNKTKLSHYVYIYIYMKPTTYDGTTTSVTQPRKNMLSRRKISLHILSPSLFSINATDFIAIVLTEDMDKSSHPWFLCNVITQPWPNVDSGFIKLPSKLGHGWVITSSHSINWYSSFGNSFCYILSNGIGCFHAIKCHSFPFIYPKTRNGSTYPKAEKDHSYHKIPVLVNILYRCAHIQPDLQIFLAWQHELQ